MNVVFNIRTCMQKDTPLYRMAYGTVLNKDCAKRDILRKQPSLTRSPFGMFIVMYYLISNEANHLNEQTNMAQMKFRIY